jgi:hypothetical protein
MPKEAAGAVEGSSSLIWRRSRQEELDETGGASEGRGREGGQTNQVS